MLAHTTLSDEKDASRLLTYVCNRALASVRVEVASDGAHIAQACLLGNTPTSDAPPLLAARQAVAAALTVWVDTDVWKPPVMPRLFSRGPPASGDMAVLAAQVQSSTLCALLSPVGNGVPCRLLTEESDGRVDRVRRVRAKMDAVYLRSQGKNGAHVTRD